MDSEQTFGEAARRSSADWYSDMRLRSKLNHWETKDLMLAPDPTTRGLVPWPTRYVGPRSKVRVGYIEGSRYDAQATVASDLGIMALSEYVEGPTPDARCRWVESRKTPASKKAIQPKPKARPDYARPRADGGGAVVLTDHQLMMDLGIKPVGFLD
jgi:hypothetical protein